MMMRPCLFVLLLISLTASAAFAGSPNCVRPDNVGFPVVDVTVNAGTVAYDHTRSRDYITQLHKTTGGVVKSAKAHPVGLTFAKTEIRYEANMAYLPARGGGGYCLWLTSVHATFGHPTLTVYVDRRYRQGSCEYMEIINHENEHVAINQRLVREYGAVLRGQLTDLVNRINPVLVRDPKRQKNVPIEMIKSSLNPLFERHLAERDRANAALDTPESYRRTQQRCRNW